MSVNSHRFLNSTAPFRPLNAWGRIPKLPRPIVSERVALYQIEVELKDGSRIRVFPKMVKAAAEDFLEVVNKAIIEGKERTWKNPRLVRH